MISTRDVPCHYYNTEEFIHEHEYLSLYELDAFELLIQQYEEKHLKSITYNLKYESHNISLY